MTKPNNNAIRAAKIAVISIIVGGVWLDTIEVCGFSQSRWLYAWPRGLSHAHVQAVSPDCVLLHCNDANIIMWTVDKDPLFGDIATRGMLPVAVLEGTGPCQ